MQVLWQACSTRYLSYDQISYKGMNWKYYDKVEKYGVDALKEVKAMHRNEPKAEYVKFLESAYEIEWMNHVFDIDNLIRLRKENALLKLKNESLKKRK
jgi:hypothetical protein